MAGAMRLRALRRGTGEQSLMVKVHEAGPYLEGLQRCAKCGAVLTDHRNAMVPEGTPPLRGWSLGAHVEIDDGGGMRSYMLTTEPVDCSRGAMH